MQHVEETQKAPEAAIHHNQHVNTMLRTFGGGDWKITQGTRQSDFGCDRVMKLEGQKIDVSLLTIVDDMMDTLIGSTPGAIKLRDAANDKTIHKNSKKVGCELEPSKEESFLRWMGPNVRKNLVAQEPCWGQVASLRRSGILDVGWKWEKGQAQ